MVNYELTNSKILNTEYRGLDMMFSRRMTRKWMMQGRRNRWPEPWGVHGRPK